ncbi:SUMF1/EgtB/PvdO family nonheme iron enzyme [bacterium]|nr:SUMF1/EgtB/PvdO family nonheme iron enzyme [bacterium]
MKALFAVCLTILLSVPVAAQQRLAVFAAAGPASPPPALLERLDAAVRRELVLTLTPERFSTLMAAAAAPGCTGRCAVRQAAEYGASLALAVRVEASAMPRRVVLTVYGAPDGAILARRAAEASSADVLVSLAARAAAQVAHALEGRATDLIDTPLTDPGADRAAAERRVAALADAAGPNSLGMQMILVHPDAPFTPAPAGQEYIQARPLPDPEAPYLLSATEVTQDQWTAVMGTNPSAFVGDRRPVERVNWLEAVAFCNRLSEMEGLEPAYVLDDGTARWRPEATGYRLPTDAEWEYACRAGSLTMFGSGGRRDDLARVGWYARNAGGRTRDVARREANPWGFHDLHGNVWEWIWDPYATLPDLSPDNVEAPGAGPDRTMRGGSWYAPAIACRTTNFVRIDPIFRSCDLGFRVARGLTDRI